LETVILKWHGPYAISTATETGVAFDKGLYMVTRKWAQIEKLIYIGRTKRSLAQRIHEHNWWLTELRGQVFVRYAIIELGTNKRFSEKRLADIEALLITYHSPPENTVNYNYYYGRLSLQVNNIGRRGPLCPVISTDDLEWVK